jgi:DNA (cytosine-5)-methyltransferase 1
MENVPGMAQMGIREQVTADLALAGEYLVTSQLTDAADFGVPQTRKRLLFIGVHHSLGVPPPDIKGSGVTSLLQLERTGTSSYEYGYRLVADTEHGQALASRLADPEDLLAVTAEQAIGDLRGLTIGQRKDVLDSNLPQATSAYQRLMRDERAGPLRNVSVPRSQADTVIRLGRIPPGGNHRDLPEELLNRYLTGQKWGPHNGSGRFSRRHYYAYRRLHPDIWAWTLNTKADSVYHYAQQRSLSVREFARLQSFPDNFWFITDHRRGQLPGRIDGGAAHSRYRQVGNAVPPLLASAVAQAIAILLAPAAEARTA